MFSINLQRPLVTLAVMAGLLAVAGPASASSVIPDGELSLVTGGIVTDNKDPDKVWADHVGNASNATGAVVAADFNYYERARPHADGAVLGFFDIPAELKSLRSSVERP